MTYPESNEEERRQGTNADVTEPGLSVASAGMTQGNPASNVGTESRSVTSDRFVRPALRAGFTLSELAEESFATAYEHGWHDNPRTFGDLIALVHSEASEALEAFRDGEKPNVTWYREDGKPEGVPSELADIIIRIGDLARRYGIDLDAAIREKCAFNRTRPYRHGGKAL